MGLNIKSKITEPLFNVRVILYSDSNVNSCCSSAGQTSRAAIYSHTTKAPTGFAFRGIYQVSILSILLTLNG